MSFMSMCGSPLSQPILPHVGEHVRALSTGMESSSQFYGAAMHNADTWVNNSSTEHFNVLRGLEVFNLPGCAEDNISAGNNFKVRTALQYQKLKMLFSYKTLL